MGGWKQLRSEINIASCIVLTGRLSGRRVAHCNRITDTLNKGKALSFSISSTFRSALCTAAAAGVMYEGVEKNIAFGTECTHQRGCKHLQGTPTSLLLIRMILDHLLTSAGSISRRLNPAGSTPGFICYPDVAPNVALTVTCVTNSQRHEAVIHIRKIIILNS